MSHSIDECVHGRRGRGPAGRGGAIIHPTLAAPAPEVQIAQSTAGMNRGRRPPPQTGTRRWAAAAISPTLVTHRKDATVPRVSVSGRHTHHTKPTAVRGRQDGEQAHSLIDAVNVADFRVQGPPPGDPRRVPQDDTDTPCDSFF